ncbi:MAG: ABC-F family ATP-binding cassette domain-containing protein [Bdellovibrionales bacterium]|nr:ABC-F family ATP-binding cassette domain-containing protein [Bdellovibrionales bacterium]
MDLITINQIEKTFGSKRLFDGLSFTIEDQQRIGLLGPNGAGKSTLLKMICGFEKPDTGEISYRKGVKFAYVAQEDSFAENQTVLEVSIERLKTSGMDVYESEVQAPIFLSLVGFIDFNTKVSELSGGWKKRLSLAIAFAQDPDVLLLDEPTNHMDWDGILWLESYIKTYKKSFLVVSHDRTFLNNVCNKIMEINPLYRDGYLAFDGGYQQFLEKKQDYTQAQLKLQDTLSNKARREIEWLRAGVKARTTKSKARAKEAYELIDELSVVKARNKSGQNKARIEVESAGKRSKKFFEIKDVTIAYGDHKIVENLNLILGPKSCVGILGSNGSGKTTVLKAIIGDLKNYSGEIVAAENLKVVYFDQKREALPQDINLMEYLGDGGDYAIFKDQSVHVASYASRFLFSSDKMQLKIGQLSGGEQARLFIAKLLLQPADVLILDEPTNDLDIDSIEVLEDALLSFEGLILLVSHDRYFLNQLCERFLALENDSRWNTYADLAQWLKREKNNTTNEKPVSQQKPKQTSKPKLSYKEKRQLETLDQDIEAAELALAQAQAALSEPEVFSNHEKMQESLRLVEEKQKKVDELYYFWESVEEKL